MYYKGEWMVPVSPPTEEVTEEKKEEVPEEPRGDSEMAPVYLKHLLPIFTQVYQRTMMSFIR
jgi:hypothetical protein